MPNSPRAHRGQPHQLYRRNVGVWLGVIASILLTIGVCAVLWRIQGLHPWILAFGSALVALVGPIPGLLSEKTRGKWLVLVAAAVIVGLGVWLASKADENLRDAAQTDSQFSRLLLSKIPSDSQDQLILSVARHMQQSVLNRQDAYVSRASAILQALRPANGHALAFRGYAARGLGDYGEMHSALTAYLHNADGVYSAEAHSGAQEVCYERVSGYCAERTAWIDHLLSNYFFAKAQRRTGSESEAALSQALQFIRDMMKVRKIGFRDIDATRDTEDLLRQIADQLKHLGQSPDAAFRLAAEVEAERAKIAR